MNIIQILRTVTEPVRTDRKIKRCFLSTLVTNTTFLGSWAHGGMGIVKILDVVPLDPTKTFPALKQTREASTQAKNLFGEPLPFVPPFKN
jgi:hypothetical protein